MNFRLSIDSSEAIVAISILAMTLVGVLSWMACRRASFRRVVVILELLRVLLVGIAVFLLNQPEATQSIKPDRKPTVVILADQSKSMNTCDVDSAGQQPLSRREAIEPLLDQATWESISDRAETVIRPFESGDLSRATNLYHALESTEKQYSNLQAIVLASDGDWNAGQPPVEMASRLRMQNVPIFSVPVGSTDRLPDLQLLNFDVPTAAVPRKPVRIPFSIESSLTRDHLAVLSLVDSEGNVIKQEVMVPAMGHASDTLLWTPKEVGDSELTLSIAAASDERILDNNHLAASVSVREEKLKVLIVESTPRWEYRFLRNALSRDPGIEVSCLLFHPSLSKRGGGNRDYIQAFPEERNQLAQFDVVFLGDIGIGEDQLSELQCELVRGLVEQQASGLVVIPGLMGRTLSLVNTSLGDLLPVEFDRSSPRGQGSQSPSPFALTESGRRSLLTRLADNDQENIRVWGSLPGIQWHAPVMRAKAGSDVLVVDRDSSNDYGRTPLIATRPFGAGKVLLMSFDSIWRWREGVEDLYQYRFWGQVVRWMAYQRNMAKGESMRLYYTPEQPKIGQTISLTANVMGNQGEPLSDGDVSVLVIASSGQTQTVQLQNKDAQWGAYAGIYTPSEPGNHRLTLRCGDTNASLDATLVVQDAALERIGKPARPDVLEELARVSRGRVLDMNDIESIVDAISEMPDPPSQIRRVRLWSHPLVAITMIGLLAIFWTGRKMAGQI